MLLIRARLDVRPDKRADFLDAVSDVVHEGRHLDGVVSFDICESVTETNVFLSVEVYQDEAAWERHMRSEIYAGARPVLRACLARDVDGHVYHVSDVRPLEP